MGKTRLEAFSDGVIAIIITIMVLEFKVPHGDDWAALQPVIPVFFNYVLSYIYVGIYWNNHHHMVHTVEHVNGKILWANLHLLFWLSVIPFVTNWMGESQFAALPTALYGAVLLLSGFAYTILQSCIIAAHGGKNSLLAKAVAQDRKGKASLALYVTAIALAFWHVWVADGIYVLVAIMWLIPDSRIEKALEK
jgi:uncharacterized membrane protein